MTPKSTPAAETSYQRYAAQEIAKYPVLSVEEERETVLALLNPETRQAAIAKLVEHNLRLVISVIAKYYPVIPSEITYMDLVCAGNDGLYVAAEKFDPHHAVGHRFSTYAVIWIRQRVRKALHECRLVRFPERKRLRLNRLRRDGVEFADDQDEYRRLSALCPERTHDADLAFQTISDPAPTPSDNAEISDLSDVLAEHIGQLDSERERDIVRHHYGVDGAEEMTLDQLATRWGISREYVRMLEVKALDRLRSSISRAQAACALSRAGLEDLTGVISQALAGAEPAEATETA